MRTRFAPSPTGPLHLGHAYAAILAHDMAMHAGGEFLIRIEDIDRSRARPEWEEMIFEDLTWLGLAWETPVLRQSERGHFYQQALQSLWQRDLLYPCDCTRRDIEQAATAPQEGAPTLTGPDGVIYPGTCRNKDWPDFDSSTRSRFPYPQHMTIRLTMASAAMSVCEQHMIGPGQTRWTVGFNETGRGARGESGWIEADRQTLVEQIGDVVVARRDMATSYHLSVVVDDAAQGITHVTRGEDLFEATIIHVVLQRLLGLPTPTYHHHRLIRDAEGKRLAKRDDARALHKYRAEGATPADIRRLVGLGEPA